MKPKKYIKKPLRIVTCETCGVKFHPYGNKKNIRFCGSISNKLSCSYKNILNLNKKAYHKDPIKHRMLVKKWLEKRPTYERDRMRKYRANGYIEPKKRKIKECIKFDIDKIKLYTSSKKQDRLIKVANLFNEGIKQNQIALELKISEGRVSQLVSLLKTIKYLC